MKGASLRPVDFFLHNVSLFRNLLIVISMVPVGPALLLGLFLFLLILFDLGHFPHSIHPAQNTELIGAFCGVVFTLMVG